MFAVFYKNTLEVSVGGVDVRRNNKDYHRCDRSISSVVSTSLLV